MRRRECTTVRLYQRGQEVGDLIACDVHGNGRSNKAWMGEVYVGGIRRDIDLPNLAAVERYAREQGLTVERLQPSAILT